MNGMTIGCDEMHSVTRILSPWSNLSMVSDEVLTSASERGTRVHAACAAYALDYPVEGLQEGDEGYFESFRDWFDATVEQVINVEQEYTCKTYGFVGHPDAVLTLKGSEEIWVIDWKTPRTLNKSFRLQIAAYRHLTQAHRGATLRLSPEGKRAILDEFTGMERDFCVFLNCLSAWRFFNE
jgi:hypothetical protein